MALSKESTSGINKIEAKRQEVIDYILTEINNGNPHVFNNPNHPSLFEQYNFKTDKTYNGMNRFILAISASIEGYKDPRWLTFKQAKELGYSVKKGSHGTTLEYWERIPDTMDKLNKDGNPVLDENGKIVQVPITREDGTQVMRWMGKPFTVFNGEQINGIPPYERQPMTEEQRIKELESILNHSEASILYDSLEDNYYQKSTDTIHLRPKDDFKSMDQLYATALHEIAHSTQHPNRLNRQYMEASNPLEELQNYAREEVVAEFTAARLNAKYNLPYSERMGKYNSTSYIEIWQQVFHESPLELIEALKKAEQAATYIENNMLVLEQEQTEQLGQSTSLNQYSLDDSYREYGGHFYALDHDPESPNLYKGDYAIQLMNDVVLEDMTVHLVNANRTITLANGTGFDSQNPSNVRSCLGCYDKLGINFHIIDKNGEFHTFESRIDLGDLDTISKTPMLDVLKSMEKWTSVKLEGLSDDVHAMVEELEDRLKRNELPSPSVQTNPKIYTEKLQALYNSHSNPEKYAEALKPVKEMLNVTQTKDLSQKPKVGLSISKPKGKSGLER